MTAIITLHLEFVAGEPPGWRVLEAPESTTLAELNSMIREVFEGLPGGKSFARLEASFDVDDDRTLRSAFGKRGNRLDLVFENDFNSLVIWHEGIASPGEAAYPRLAAGGETLLDEENPFEVSTIQPRPLDGAQRGEWEEPELDATLGREMIERFLDANDLDASNREAFEGVRSDDALFAEFEWATRRLTQVEEGVSPRMRRPFHELRDAGIDVEVGLLQQLGREELYRADSAAVGLVADILAGLEIHEAVEPIVELLRLPPETNSRAFFFLGYAVADLDGPDFERVFDLIEDDSPSAQLDILAAVSSFSQDNQRLADGILALFDDFEELDDKEYALDVLISHHFEQSKDRILAMLDDLIDLATAGLEREGDDPFQVPLDLINAQNAVTFAEGLQDAGVELGAAREKTMRGIRKLRDELFSAAGMGTYKAGDEPGRNDPCPCGSGKKYKRCCMRK